MAIDRDEYKSRLQAFAARLDGAGLPGAVVVSRGGSTLDRYADVFYLTGHYQSYSYLADEPGLFSGRAHTAIVVSTTGRAVLCVSVPEYDSAAVVADDVRCSGDFAATIAGAIGSLGLDSGNVGLVGSDVLPLKLSRALAERLPAVNWRDCDELLLALRRIKSPAECAAIRAAASVHVDCLEAARAAVCTGNREADIIAEFGQVALGRGAGLYFTSISSGPSIARWTSRASPGFGLRRLAEGDMLRFDMGIVLDGYLSDFGRTFVVGEPRPEQRRLIETLHHGIDAVLDAIAPGRSVRDIVAAGERALREAGVTATDEGPGTIHASFPVHWGHGLGLGWERPYMTENEELTLAPGMYLAIERTLTATGIGTAAAEQTLLVEDVGIEILSEGPSGRWS
jgi:Xaa-Pro dipeptidase